MDRGGGAQASMFILGELEGTIIFMDTINSSVNQNLDLIANF